jgi:hypothetical protein
MLEYIYKNGGNNGNVETRQTGSWHFLKEIKI